jgi:alpha-D-ribose 1-methylphosphonate 5-triphosphate synthase subunit PhnH
MMTREVNYDEVFDAQEQFRIILESMSRPGKLGLMPDMDVQPPAGLNKASALIAFALLNTDVTFFATGDNREEIEAYIALNTAANPVKAEEADFIFINGFHDNSIIAEAKVGNLSYPEESATFVIDVDTISAESLNDSTLLTLKGPGIKGQTHVYIKGIATGVLEAVKEQNLEFPLGVDLIITDKHHNLLCIPRSNQFVIGSEGVLEN